MRIFLMALVATLFCCAPPQLGSTEHESTVDSCEETCGHHGDKYLLCHYPPGNEENPQTICVGSNLVPDHLTHGDDCGECLPTCGNGSCEEGETCEDCAYDCGVCGPVCGDAFCDEGESCENCEADCGECTGDPPECDDETCGDGESCSSCPSDCGECEPVCGDFICESGEDCEVCPADCGACSPNCGDEVCEVDENCKSCPADCGGCVVVDPPKDAGVDPDITVTGGEMGGCNTGGTSGLLGIFLVAGAMLLMRRKKNLLVLMALLTLALPTVASAQVSGDPGSFKLERFEMAMDEHSIITVEGAEVDRKGSGGFHFSLGYADDPLVLQEDTGDGFKRVGALVGHQLSAEIGGYLTFTDSLAFGISLPMVLSQDRDADELTGLPGLNSGDIGDPRFMLKYQLAEQTKDEFNVAIGATATIPRETDEGDYLGGNSASIAPYLAVSDNYDSWRWAFNGGVKIQEDTEIVDLTVSDEAFARLGIAKSWGVNELGVSLSGTSSASDLFTDNSSYAEAMAAYSRKYDSGLSSFIGTGIGLNAGFGSPDWRVFLGVRLDIDAPVKVAKVTPAVTVVPEIEPEPKPEPPVKVKVLTIPDAFFAFDKAEVLPQYESKMQGLADALLMVNREHPEVEAFLVIAGHTDSIGTDDYNMKLGEKRARSVSELLQRLGAPADVLVLVSFGENNPAATNSTVKGRAQNRRVEIYFSALEDILDYYEFSAADGVPDDESTFDSFGILKRK